MKERRYYAYIRVSTIRQGERGVSLTEQRSAIEAYAARNGLTIVRWYEEMETAAKHGRREFTAMLTALKRHSADGLIVHKIDRSARNMHDWAELGDFIDHGVDVRFVSDNLDLQSTGGRLTADLQAAIAAHYVRNLREEVKKGMYGRLKQGLYPWGAPIGYVNNGKGKPKTIDPIKGPLVQHLFERYASNTVSFEALRHEMAGMGLTINAGKPLFPNTLTNILNNPFYMGVIKVGTTGETFAGVHEPLITKELFDSVQAVLRGKTVPKAKKNRFLFRQRVQCRACKRRTLTGETQKGHVYYRCHGRECASNPVSGDALEGVVLRNVARVRLPEGDVREVRDVVAGECRSSEANAERLKAAVSGRLQLADARIQRLTDLLVDDVIDKATYNARKEAHLMERQGILSDLKRLDTGSPLQELFDKFEHNNTALLQYELMNDDEKREMLEIVCSNVSTDGKNIAFTLRSPYREIAELDKSKVCAHGRDDVRTKAIAAILVSMTERGETIYGSYNVPNVPNVLTSPAAALEEHGRRTKARARFRKRRRRRID